MGDLIADEIHGWRWSNRIRIACKAQELLDDLGIDARQLPNGFLLPFLEEAGNIEEPELQDMWSRLLASATKADEFQQRSFIELLKQISPLEAKLLSALVKLMFRYRQIFDLDRSTGKLYRRLHDQDEATLRQFDCNEPSLLSSLSHLESLGVLVPELDAHAIWEPLTTGGRRRSGEERFIFAKLTPFGREFMIACSMKSCETLSSFVVEPWLLEDNLKRLAERANQQADEAMSAAEDAQRSAEEANMAAEEAKSEAESASVKAEGA